MFRYTDKPRHPHPVDRDDAFADAVLFCAGAWGFCLTLGVAIYGGWL